MPRIVLGAKDSKMRKLNLSPLRIYILVLKDRQHTNVNCSMSSAGECYKVKWRKALSEEHVQRDLKKEWSRQRKHKGFAVTSCSGDSQAEQDGQGGEERSEQSWAQSHELSGSVRCWGGSRLLQAWNPRGRDVAFPLSELGSQWRLSQRLGARIIQKGQWDLLLHRCGWLASGATPSLCP